MFSCRPAREHARRKYLISHVYSKSYIHSSTTAALQAHTILFDRLIPIIQASTAEALDPHGIDVHSIFLAMAMDFISCYVFGLEKGTNFLQRAAYREHWLELYKSRNNYGLYDQELPFLTKICRQVGIPLCPRFVDDANAELEKWFRDICIPMLIGGRKWSTFPLIDQPPVLWALSDGAAKEAAYQRSSPLYENFLRRKDFAMTSELFDHVLAGQETAGVTLTYLTWRLSQSLPLQTELREELLSLDPNPSLAASGTPSLPDPKALDALPLLHAVVMETLRLHAPIPGALPRVTPDKGCSLAGYAVPGGVRVAAMAYTLHRDERVFPSPEKWDHTRWLPGAVSEEERKERNRAFWAFSSGGRMCIGSNFAMHGELIGGFLWSRGRRVLDGRILTVNRDETHCCGYLLELHDSCGQ